METFLIEITPVIALAFEVIAGKWGNDEERKQRLESAGYDYEKIQHCVNDLLALVKRYE